MRLVDDFKSRSTPKSGLPPAYKSAADFLPFLNYRSGVFARGSGKASQLTTDMAELDSLHPVQESWPDRPEHALHRVFSYRLYFNRPQGL